MIASLSIPVKNTRARTRVFFLFVQRAEIANQAVAEVLVLFGQFK